MPLEIMDNTFLVTEICDKLTTTVELLKQDGYFKEEATLREIYDEYLHPAKIDITDEKMWKALGEGSVLDVFQFSTGVGLATAKQIKPKNPTEMTDSNAIMRLMGEKGKERPLDRYSRLRNDMSQWYAEVMSRGLSQEEIKVLEPYYLPRFGVPALQEDLMEICMDKNIANFSLKDANSARKTVAKKKMEEIPVFKEKFMNSCKSLPMAEYVWDTAISPQLGYSFSLPHSLAYSFVGIQTLYLGTNYPSIYWNCACLIVNAGGTDLLEETEDEEEENEEKNKKNKNTDYGKISKAIGESKSKNIIVLPPDINKSDLIFKPDATSNSIIYGLKGINKIGINIVYEIFNNRPYSSIEDFISKVKIDKPKMINLIKAGAFDSLYPQLKREMIMKNYLETIADKKKRITLQNMQMLIAKNLIPEELDFERRLFNFNKYLKSFKEKEYYRLDSNALRFYGENYSEDSLIDVEINENGMSALIPQKIWDNTYKKGMSPVRAWMKENQEEILNNLNNILLEEVAEKYTEGNISKWEMDSLSFYYHDHELQNLRNDIYDVENFFNLSSDPEVERTFPAKDGGEIKIYKITRIAGTVIDKDKNKSQVILLTPDGVVTVKVWKNQFAAWDRQISEKDVDGKKHVLEKSWFQRGTKLIITGMRRDDTFVPKKYKNTEYPLFEKIVGMDDRGFITESSVERIEVDE